MFWIAIGVAIFGGYQTGLDTYRDFNGTIQVEGQELAAVLDFSFAAAYYFGITSLVAVLRRYLRRRAHSTITQAHHVAPVAGVSTPPLVTGTSPRLDQPPLFESAVTRYCESCGTALNPGARFCSSCGRELVVLDQTSATDKSDVELERLRASVAKPLYGSRRVLIAVVLVLAAVVGDWALRNKEMDSLMDAVELSESAIVSGDAATDKAFNSSNQLPHYQREGAISDNLYPAARAAAVEVADTGDGVASVFVLPWHRSVRRAQTRYMEQ